MPKCTTNGSAHKGAEPFPRQAWPPGSAPRLRPDTNMLLGHVVAHIERLQRRAQRGEVDLGCPQAVAEYLCHYINEQAPEFLEITLDRSHG